MTAVINSERRGFFNNPLRVELCYALVEIDA